MGRRGVVRIASACTPVRGLERVGGEESPGGAPALANMPISLDFYGRGKLAPSAWLAAVEREKVEPVRAWHGSRKGSDRTAKEVSDGPAAP